MDASFDVLPKARVNIIVGTVYWSSVELPLNQMSPNKSLGNEQQTTG